MSFRTYRQLTGDDRSQLGAQVGAQRARVARRLGSVRAVVGVMSGKGGVGKSAVTAALALGGSRQHALRIGVLDGDLKSPTVARLLGAHGQVRVSEDGVHPIETADGIRVMSTSLLLAEGAPLEWREHAGERFVWRGVLETGALREFLGDVVWGTLDLLLVDLPPGADKLSDLVEMYPALTGALVVTIPSDESLESVRRSMHSARASRIPLLGVVENMSGYACEGCSTTRPLFAGDAGAQLAGEFQLPLLARIPFRASSTGTTSLLLGTTQLESVLAALTAGERALT